MDMEQKYNQRNPAVKRLMREACELREATDEYSAKPLDDNLFEWHFTVHGSPGSEYEGGIYHGRIILPTEYPMKPPNIILLTPNGRFETNKKICLSISGYHPETWQPSWSIRTALLALIAFMSSPGRGSIGALDYTPEERKTLARQSLVWSCETCGPIRHLLGSSKSKPAPQLDTHEQELLQRVTLKAEDEKSENNIEELPASQVNSQTIDSSFQSAPESPPPIADIGLISIDASSNMVYRDNFLLFIVALLMAALAFLVARRLVLSMFW